MYITLVNHRTDELKNIKVGFSWVLFLFSIMLDIPLFLRRLHVWGAIFLVLRSFLRARMAKRANLNADKYLQEKLKFSDEQMGEYQNWLVTEAEQKKRPSKRIVFPQGKKPVLSPYVGEVKEF